MHALAFVRSPPACLIPTSSFMPLFLLLLVFVCVVGLVLAQTLAPNGASNGLPNGTSYQGIATDLADSIPTTGGQDGMSLDGEARTGVVVEEPAVLQANSVAVILALRAIATAEIDFFFQSLSAADAITLNTHIVRFQGEVANAVTNFTQQRQQFIADLLNDIANWKQHAANLRYIITNFTASNGLSPWEKIKILYDGWLLHLARRAIEAKIYLGHRFTALAELKWRYANATIWVSSVALRAKTLNNTFITIGDIAVIKRQLVDILTEIKVREAELLILIDVVTRAAARQALAVIEAATKYAAFRAAVYRRLADIRQDLRDAVKLALIKEDIRRRVIAWVENVTDVQVVVDATGQEPRITIIVTKAVDGQVIAVLRLRLAEVVKRILVAIAQYDERNIILPAVPPPAKKRQAGSESYTIIGTYSAASPVVLSLAAAVIASVVALL